MKEIDLKKISTLPPNGIDKEEIKYKTEEIVGKLVELQRLFFANHNRALLVVLQGMDASGKDSAIRHVFGPMNPMWVRVHSFKKPVGDELEHDYLRRIHKKVPPKWIIWIFNRSHYEDILVPSVEWYLSDSKINKRYAHINGFEKMLVDENIIVLKFYLHISHQRQIEKLKERLKIPYKMWKYSCSDFEVTEKRDKYMRVYNKVLTKTNTRWAPWNIIPADKKRYKNYLIAQKTYEILKWLKLKWPKLDTKEC